MATPLPSQLPAPTYLDFFGMERAPFGRPAAPSEIFHSDQCALLDSHLADATDQPGGLILVCGAEGAGKTTLLNKYLSGLGDDLCYAAFDETCAEGRQFHSSFLAQIGFGEIVGSLHELQSITREFLIHCGRSGRPVLFFLDDAQLARPAVLEQLRWAAELKIDNEHVVSIVLAGNGNLPRIIESPAMRSLKSRHGTRFHIRAYSEIETNDYVRHQLDLAKAADAVNFSDGSFALIYRFTGGIPGAINRLCNAVLTESCAQGSRAINEQRIRQVAAAHRFLPRVMSMRSKRRRKTDRDLPPPAPDPDAGGWFTGQPPGTGSQHDDSWQASLPQDLALNELLVQLSELSSQLEVATKEKRLALGDVARRDEELRQLHAQLASHVEAAGKLTQALDEKAGTIAELGTALSDSEKRRHAAEVIRRSLARNVDVLQGRLDAGTRELEVLTARRRKSDETINQLTRELAESKATLADRDRTVEALAASAAELATLKRALAEGETALLQREESSQDLVAELETERDSTQRANAALAQTRERLQAVERQNEEYQGAVEELHAALLDSARTSEKVDALEKSLEVARQENAALRRRLGTLASAQRPVAEKDDPAAEPDGDQAQDGASGGAATLELFLDGKLRTVVDLAGGPSQILVGRAPDCELHLDSRFVSRHHALISCAGNRVVIEDLNSANGVFVDSRRVSRSDLHPGNTIAIGNFRLRFMRGQPNQPIAESDIPASSAARGPGRTGVDRHSHSIVAGGLPETS